MARTDTLKNFLTDVANSIREKKGTSDKILASNFDTEIQNIQSGSEESIYDYFFSSVSGNVKAQTLFKTIPKIDFSKATNTRTLFYQSSIVTVPELDLSNVTDAAGMFNDCKELKTIPNLNTIKATDMSYLFIMCPKLESIGEVNADSATNITGIVDIDSKLNKFLGLKNLGKGYLTSSEANFSNYTLNLSQTNLDHDSLMNVINKLYDIKSKGCQVQRLILGSILKAKLTTEEIAIATSKGWNVE